MTEYHCSPAEPFCMMFSAPVEEAEAMVDTLTIDGVTLSDAQLSAFSGCDLQQLAELSQELHYANDAEEMDNQGKEK